MLPGHATADGTARYQDRFPQLRDAGHFRAPKNVPGVNELYLSSIGLGTYLGETDEAADRAYTDSIAAALRSGINVLDTAINYRHQRSERNIGAALKTLVNSGELRRDEALVCTKAGYLSFDGNPPADPSAYFRREYIDPGILDPKEIVGGMHCMAPAYLANQSARRSRRNLGLETIDVFYIHNPESQLAEVPRDEFHRRLLDAFHGLEAQVKEGAASDFMASLPGTAFAARAVLAIISALVSFSELAIEAGGKDHHFPRFIQLPFNLAHARGLWIAESAMTGKRRNRYSRLRLELGIAVMGSATLRAGPANPRSAGVSGKSPGLAHRRRECDSVLAICAGDCDRSGRNGPPRTCGGEPEMRPGTTDSAG